MIKSEFISSFEDFKILIEKIGKSKQQEFLGLKANKWRYYRGQASNSYKLLPWIARRSTNAVELKQKEIELFEEFNKIISQKDLSSIIRKSQGNYNYISEWEMFWQAQHLEIPTRFMDWSLSSYTAMYFAVRDSKKDYEDGQFWVLSIDNSYIANYAIYDCSPYEFGRTVVLNPYSNDYSNFDTQTAELRKISQSGNFLIQNYKNSLIPLEEQEEFTQCLEKFIIPKEKKKEFRDRLLEMSYTEEKLLPNIEPNFKLEAQKLISKYKF